MTSILSARRGNANVTSVVDFPKSEERFTAFAKIVSVIRDAWPKKTSAHVAHLTGVSERAVKFWLAGETRMSLEHVAALLRTDAGYEILAAIMGDAKPEWWLVAQTGQNVRRSKKAIRKEQERIDRLRAQLELLDDK